MNSSGRKLTFFRNTDWAGGKTIVTSKPLWIKDRDFDVGLCDRWLKIDRLTLKRCMCNYTCKGKK